MSEELKPEEKKTTIQFHVAPDIDYLYRDIFNVYVGTGDVVIEFGIRHRAMPEHVTIANRMVMSYGNAHLLLQTLQKALTDAQLVMQRALMEKKP